MPSCKSTKTMMCMRGASGPAAWPTPSERVRTFSSRTERYKSDVASREVGAKTRVTASQSAWPALEQESNTESQQESLTSALTHKAEYRRRCQVRSCSGLSTG